MNLDNFATQSDFFPYFPIRQGKMQPGLKAARST